MLQYHQYRLGVFGPIRGFSVTVSEGFILARGKCCLSAPALSSER